LAGVCLIKSPLHSKDDEHNEDGGIAVYFQHGLLVYCLLKISERNSFYRFNIRRGYDREGHLNSLNS
jgi:hypothetical protein